jgi:hypothetical protein
MQDIQKVATVRALMRSTCTGAFTYRPSQTDKSYRFVSESFLLDTVETETVL